MTIQELKDGLIDLQNELIDLVIQEHPEIDWDNDVYADYSDYDDRIGEIQNTKKMLREEEQDVRYDICSMMELKKLTKIDNKNYTVTYYNPKDYLRFNSKKFKEEHAALYKRYSLKIHMNSHVVLRFKWE
jgi:hypothetical protein